jgi:hypothetical protein
MVKSQLLPPLRQAIELLSHDRAYATARDMIEAAASADPVLLHPAVSVR